MSQPIYDRMAVIGCGLIGASIISAAREAGAVGHVAVCDLSPVHREQVAALTAQLTKLDQQEREAAADAFQARVAAFLEAEKAGRQDELKKMIGE